MKCANCGEVINDTYFSCLDNFLQVKYFDTEEENVFCSTECFCESLSLEELEVEEDEEVNND